MSKILSDQGGKYTVPYKGSEIKEIPNNMSKMKQLDEMANKLVPQIMHKIYSTVATELSYSDLDLEGDDMNDAHDYVMTLVINKLINN
jgi:hypothetical protein